MSTTKLLFDRSFLANRRGPRTAYYVHDHGDPEHCRLVVGFACQKKFVIWDMITGTHLVTTPKTWGFLQSLRVKLKF